LNGTRLTSLHSLFESLLRLCIAIATYSAREAEKVKDDRALSAVAQYNRLLAITLAPLEWQAAKEAEAGLRACTCQIVLSETEKSWTAAMKGPVEAKLKKSFKPDAIVMAIDIAHHNPGCEVKRHPIGVKDMSCWGREFFERAQLESEHRFGPLSEDELVNAMLELRTLGYADQYLSETEQHAAAEYLETAYVEYCVTAHTHRMRAGQTAAEATVSPAPETKQRRSVFARSSSMELPKEGKAVQNQLRKSYANEFKVAWVNWNKLAMDLDWCKLHPNEKHLQGKTTDDLDIVWD
jgi:hypothetical protein